jgi:hypothetical protein
VHKNLGCFHLSSIGNNVAMNNCVQLFKFLFLVLLGTCRSRLELPDCYLQWPYHFTSLLALYEGFAVSLSTIAVMCFFDCKHPGRCAVASHYGFDLTFND